MPFLPARSAHRIFPPAILAVALAAGTLPGCSRSLGLVGPSGGSLRATSQTTGNTLSPSLTTIAYIDRGKGEADVYLTDLTPAQLGEDTPIDELAGSVVHIKLFLKPNAGQTPIEQTATSAVVRHLVLANGAIGIYGGGGFVFQRGKAGDRAVGGSLADASMKLVRSTPDFADQLGAALLSGSFSARLDSETAESIEALLIDAESYTQRVEPVFAETAHAGNGP